MGPRMSLNDHVEEDLEMKKLEKAWHVKADTSGVNLK
jgi:hypothetical protein